MTFPTRQEAQEFATERDFIALYPRHNNDGKFPTAGKVTGSAREGWTTASCRAYIEQNPSLLERCSPEFLEQMDKADDSLLPAHVQPLADRRAAEAARVQAEKAKLAAMDDAELEEYLDIPLPQEPQPEPDPPRLQELVDRFPREDRETLVERAKGLEKTKQVRERRQREEEARLLEERETADTLPPEPVTDEDEITRPSSTPPRARE